MNGLRNGLQEGLTSGLNNGLAEGLTNGLTNGLYLNEYLLDNDAYKFLVATNIHDALIVNRINNLVIYLKSAGLWTKMKTIYPFVGGTSTTHKFNLKDPRDLDAAYRLSFVGGWTHSANGATPNGTNAYANTFLTPSTGLSSINNLHFSFYNRTSNAYSNSPNHGLIPSTLNDRMYFADQNTYYQITGTENATFWITFANANRQGSYISTRTASNSRKTYKNGSVAGTNTNNDTGGILNTTLNFLIGAANGLSLNSTYTNNQLAFASIGDGLTDADAINFNNIVQDFQRGLNRAV